MCSWGRWYTVWSLSYPAGKWYQNDTTNGINNCTKKSENFTKCSPNFHQNLWKFRSRFLLWFFIDFDSKLLDLGPWVSPGGFWPPPEGLYFETGVYIKNGTKNDTKNDTKKDTKYPHRMKSAADKTSACRGFVIELFVLGGYLVPFLVHCLVPFCRFYLFLRTSIIYDWF